MIEVRPFGRRAALTTIVGLKAKHHFSFTGYCDADRMGCGALRVWNDDEIAPKHRLPTAFARRHGDHHLCAAGCHHAR
jgi:quercetin 2,3-dioxygenase